MGYLDRMEATKLVRSLAWKVDAAKYRYSGDALDRLTGLASSMREIGRAHV